MVVGKESSDSVGEDALCTACEMAVVWMKSQLNNAGVKDKVLEYVAEVIKTRHASVFFMIVGASILKHHFVYFPALR